MKKKVSVLLLVIGMIIILSDTPGVCQPEQSYISNKYYLENTSNCYSIIDLGVLPGHESSSAYGINNYDQVVGISKAYDYGNNGIATAFLWENNEIFGLGIPNEAKRSEALAINDKRQIVGNAFNVGGYGFHALLWDNSTMIDIGSLGGEYYRTFAHDINNDGQVVGFSNTVEGSSHAFLYNSTNPDGMQDLDTLGGWESYATSINNIGQIVGESETDTSTLNIFLYNIHLGQMEDLGNYPAGTMGRIFAATNDNNQIVFEHSVFVDDDHWEIHILCYNYNTGLVTDLGTTPGYLASWATAINNAGQVVGWSTNGPPTGTGFAFLWEDGLMINLNDIEPVSSSGWILERANDINEAGDIVGSGINPEGKERAYLLKRISPDRPNKPNGQTEGEVGVEYFFSTNATDLDGDQIRYGWDWDGDLIVDEWTDFYDSGEIVVTSHVYSSNGTYDIRVKANDTSGAASIWSPAHTITIALSSPLPELEIKILNGKIFVKNNGYAVATDIEWSIRLEGGIIFFPIGRIKLGDIEEIKIGEEALLSTFVFGLGRVNIYIDANCLISSDNVTASAFIVGPFVLNLHEVI